MAATRTWWVIVMMLIVMVWMMTRRRCTMSVVTWVPVVRIVIMSARFVPRVVVRFLVRTTRFFTMIMRLVLVIARLSSLVVSV